MNMQLLPRFTIARAATIIISALFISTTNAQTAPPPGLGEETKGTPAIEETATASEGAASNTATDSESRNQSSTPFGSSTIVESRRTSGQVYSIELKHSNAPTQYIEETDSDGNIEYKSNDLEVTPNLPKWKIGSW